LDKSNDYGKLLERRTMMVQADLNDKLQRDILVIHVLFLDLSCVSLLWHN